MQFVVNIILIHNTGSTWFKFAIAVIKTVHKQRNLQSPSHQISPHVHIM